DSKAHLMQTVEFLRSLAAPGREIIACLGNWEHWSMIKPEEIRKAYEAAGVRLLVDERAMTSHGISVYGSDDGLHANDRASLVQKAVIGKNQGILITHSPFILDRFPTDGRKYGLALSGHTHGGQVYAGPLTFWLPPGSGRFVKGHYDTPAGPAYVSRGIGTVMINARFMSRPELPYFTLTRA
ncbi:MAG: metallophosphoesterase, partial [Nitrospinota bacterium]|nr:metallophosphoesterase [Nitrospinota bacterium]